MGEETGIGWQVRSVGLGAGGRAAPAQGVVEGVEIANMHRQTEQREERLLHASENATDVVAVVAGDGNRAIFESLGAARVVEGGQSMNPSTAELVAALEALAAPEAILLPNNSNVILGAEQAARATEKPVEVVPTDSIPAGLAAMVVFDGVRPAAGNAAAIRGA